MRTRATDRRGIGDIDTLTVRGLSGTPRWRRLKLSVIPQSAGDVSHRSRLQLDLAPKTAVGLMRSGWRPWASTGDQCRHGLVDHAADLAGRRRPVPASPSPDHLIGAAIGVWLFYVQHQFEETCWDQRRELDFHEAALMGSSHYDLPGVLRWFTANIGVHHVHHLCSRIPYYRLPMVLRDHPELAEVGRLTLRESLKCCGSGCGAKSNGGASRSARCAPKSGHERCEPHRLNHTDLGTSYFRLGKLNSAPPRIPVGQRAVTVLRRV